jgi:hypothetical protein
VRPGIIPTAAQLVAAYEPSFRASMTVRPDRVEDPASLRSAYGKLDQDAAALVDLCWLAAATGEIVPDRLRDTVARAGDAPWRAGLLLPRATPSAGSQVHPLHYAGSCRLNPAARALRPRWLPSTDAVATFAPADARWDAVVLAADLESQPATLNADGSLRKDAERRLLTGRGGDEARWALALRWARATGLVRVVAHRLHGFPEGHARPVQDPAALCSSALAATAAALVLRVASETWVDVAGLGRELEARAREVLVSPIAGCYPGTEVAFDADGWVSTEIPALREALDVLHRVGAIDASRDASGVTAFRRPGARPALGSGWMVLPDGDVLVHVGEVPLDSYGRLCRLAPFVDGDALRRHRLARVGVAADMTAGHHEPVEFLAAGSKHGAPPTVADMVREWERSASRVTLLTGVTVVEAEDGTLSVGEAAPGMDVVDYREPPRARFFSHGAHLRVAEGENALTVRAALERVAVEVGRDSAGRIFRPELRRHDDPTRVLDRLRAYCDGGIPGEVEAMVLAGAGLGPVTSANVLLLHLPSAAAPSLRRDRVLAPYFSRAVSTSEVVVEQDQVERVRARLAELGIAWGEGGA